MMPLLIAKGIKKSFFSPHRLDIIKGIDLEVAPNESVALKGRSGEGKSTLLHILGTLETPTEGTLHISGMNALEHRLELRRRHIGFVFQSFHLLDEETVLDNVLTPARIIREEKKKRAFAEALIERVGLKERVFHLAKELSGGEKQRVAIARALINDPKLILADEPTGNLDNASADVIHELLFSLVDEGRSLVVVTHEASLAKMCDRELVLSEGRL